MDGNSELLSKPDFLPAIEVLDDDDDDESVSNNDETEMFNSEEDEQTPECSFSSSPPSSRKKGRLRLDCLKTVSVSLATETRGIVVLKLPGFLVDATNLLRRNMKMQDLFCQKSKQSSSSSRVELMKYTFYGEYGIPEYSTIYDVCDLLLLFFKSIETPLLTKRLEPLFFKLSDNEFQILSLCRKLPEIHLHTLAYLSRQLSEICKYSKYNHLSVSSLSQRLSASIFRSKTSDNKILKCCIQNSWKLLTLCDDLKTRKITVYTRPINMQLGLDVTKLDSTVSKIPKKVTAKKAPPSGLVLKKSNGQTVSIEQVIKERKIRENLMEINRKKAAAVPLQQNIVQPSKFVFDSTTGKLVRVITLHSGIPQVNGPLQQMANDKSPELQSQQAVVAAQNLHNYQTVSDRIKSKEFQFRCEICGMKFQTNEFLHAHFDTKLHTKSVCSKCGYISDSKCLQNLHMKSCHNLLIFADLKDSSSVNTIEKRPTDDGDDFVGPPNAKFAKFTPRYSTTTKTTVIAKKMQNLHFPKLLPLYDTETVPPVLYPEIGVYANSVTSQLHGYAKDSLEIPSFAERFYGFQKSHNPHDDYGFGLVDFAKSFNSEQLEPADHEPKCNGEPRSHVKGSERKSSLEDHRKSVKIKQESDTCFRVIKSEPVDDDLHARDLSNGEPKLPEMCSGKSVDDNSSRRKSVMTNKKSKNVKDGSIKKKPTVGKMPEKCARVSFFPPSPPSAAATDTIGDEPDTEEISESVPFHLDRILYDD